MTIIGLADQLLCVDKDYEIASIYTTYYKGVYGAMVTVRGEEGKNGRFFLSGESIEHVSKDSEDN